jgi:hypothetical protein
MKHLYLLAWIVASASVVSAQSLAEIAKKEKQRREKLPAGRVYSERDLGASGSAEPTADEEEGQDESTPKEKLDDWMERQEDRDRKRDEKWKEIFASFKSRFATVLAQRDEYADLYFNGLPIGADNKRISCQRILARWSVPGWTQHAIACESLEDKIREQEALLKEIEEECLEAARRLGVPPGKARLY